MQLNPGGEAIVLDSGGYGPVTITQSLTIEAPPGVLAFIHPPAGDAITVNAGATDTVVLRGLVLNGGTSNGIGVISGGSVHIENCVISGFNVDGIVVVQSANNKLFVSDTTIRRCFGAISTNSNSGGTNQVNIDRCRLQDNNEGIAIAGAGKASVRDTVASGNSVGMIVFFDAQLEVENCQVTNNGSAGILAVSSIGSGYLVRVSNSTITNNGIGLSNTSIGVLASRSNNTIQENGIDLSPGVTTYGAK